MMHYTIKKSARAKRLRITIKPDTTVVITVPHRMSLAIAERFVRERKDWIEEKLEMLKRRALKYPASPLPKGSKKGLTENKEAALALIHTRLAHYNTHYGFVWKNVSVKNLTTRWGSCSKIGNLNFSYKIVFLPPEVADYLVVHELCHLGEFNHSKKFWKLVEKTIPNYASLRKQLRGLD